MRRRLLPLLSLLVCSSAWADPGYMESPTLQGPARGRLFSADSNTVAHVYWNGTNLVDRLANAWTMSGTVPQTARNSRIPYGSGPYSESNFYSTSASALQFASGVMSVCVAFVPASLTTEQVMVGDVTSNTGWFLETTITGTASFGIHSGASVSVATVEVATAGAATVACGGRDAGNTIYVKMNRGTTATAANPTYATPVGTAAVIGKYPPVIGLSVRGTILEVWASTTPASDALFTQQINRALGAMGK